MAATMEQQQQQQQQQQHQLQNLVLCPPSRYVFKKFKCSNCDYRAVSRWYIKRHIQRKHKDKLLTTEVVEVVNQQESAPSLPVASLLTLQQQQQQQPELLPTTPPPPPPQQLRESSPATTPPQQSLAALPSANNNNNNNNNNNAVVTTTIDDRGVEEIVLNEDNQNKYGDDEDSWIPPQPDRDADEAEKRPRPWSYDPSSINSWKKFIGSSITSNDGLQRRKRFEPIMGPISLQIKEHFKIFMQGPAGCGKSTWVYRLLENLPRIAKHIPKQVLYIYTVQQAWMGEMLKKKLVQHFIKGNDDIEAVLEEHFQNESSSLVIFDDQMHSKVTTAYVAKLFTIDGRHNNLSLIWMSQAVFGAGGTNGRLVRLIRTNADYLVIFKAPGDVNSIIQLSSQMCTGGLIKKIYDYITVEQAHSYLMINITQTRTPHCTYLTNIFRENGPYIRVFVPTPTRK